MRQPCSCTAASASCSVSAWSTRSIPPASTISSFREDPLVSSAGAFFAPLLEHSCVSARQASHAMPTSAAHAVNERMMVPTAPCLAATPVRTIALAEVPWQMAAIAPHAC